MIYYRLLVLFISFVFSTSSFSQGRIVLNNDPYIVFDNGTAGTPVFVVVDNANANAITTLGTGGNIVTENEFNKIRWRINNQTGLYNLPYTTVNDVKIPFSMQVTGAGAGGTHVDFSTYGTSPMNFPRPSMVTHMTDALTASIDNSLWVIDRFWLIDAMNYGTRPTTTLTFGYDPNEMPGPNTVTAGNLRSQRFQSVTDTWNVSPALVGIFFGTDNTAQDRVEFSAVPSGELWEAWTLADRFNLLPVELLYFNARCEETFVQLNWATGSEQNAMHFEVEKSTDGYTWEIIAELQAQGTTNQETTYSYRDYNPAQQTAYYRLIQTDFDGTSESFDIQSVEACGEENNDIWVYNQLDGQYQVTINAQSDQFISVNLYDMNGKQVRQTKQLAVVKGSNVFLFNDNHVSTGMYMLTIEGSSMQYNHKLIIQK